MVKKTRFPRRRLNAVGALTAASALKFAKGAYGVAKVAYPYAKKAISAYKKYTKKSGVSNTRISAGTGTAMASSSYAAKLYPNVRDMFKGCQIQKSQTINGSHLKSATNQQIVGLYSMGNSNDLSTISGYIQNAMTAANGVRLQSNNGTLGTTGSNTNTTRYFLQSMTQELFFQSACTGNTFLDLYECVARQDNDIPPLTAWNSGYQDSVSALARTRLDIGATPFNSPQFCSMFKIQKIKHIELAQGRGLRFTHTYKCNKMIDMERNINLINYKDVTSFILAVAYGQPADEALTDAVGISYVDLDVIQNVKFNFSSVWQPTKTIVYSNNLATITTANIVNVGTGTVVSIADA